jgi:hypothetical protein
MGAVGYGSLDLALRAGYASLRASVTHLRLNLDYYPKSITRGSRVAGSRPPLNLDSVALLARVERTVDHHWRALTGQPSPWVQPEKLVQQLGWLAAQATTTDLPQTEAKRMYDKLRALNVAADAALGDPIAAHANNSTPAYAKPNLNAAKQRPALVVGQDAAEVFNIPPATIRTWAARGKIGRHGSDHKGRVLYDLNEIMAHTKNLANMGKPQKVKGNG